MKNSYLLLGEGNFSYSAVLAKQLKTIHPSTSPESMIFTATSFDSHDEVLQKYPESVPILRLLGSMLEKGVTVLHNIDATRSLYHQLSSSSSASHSGLSTTVPPAFENIIFNFPHLGIEDAQTHRSMLAHTMSSVCEIMSNTSNASSCSRFFLSLADAQAERWGMLDMAARNLLHLEESFPFLDAHWEGYEIKRHQSGRSFRRRVQSCSIFVFRRIDGELAHGMEPVRSPPTAFQQYIRDLNTRSNLPPPASELGPEPVLAWSGKRARTVAALKPSRPGKESKRAFITSTEGLFREFIPDALSTASGSGGGGAGTTGRVYWCQVCRKSFVSEQAVRTHVYSVHVLVSTGPGAILPHENTDVNSPNLPSGVAHAQCGYCGRLFPGGPAALAQHVNDMHNGAPPLRPHWAQPQPSSSAHVNTDQEISLTAAIPSHECSICGINFASLEELSLHSKGDRGLFHPKTLTRALRCLGCPSRSFVDERSLRQHLGRCGAHARANDTGGVAVKGSKVES